MNEREYERDKVLQYAKKWAYGRNTEYYDYDKVGGDCTNFASQCLYAGSKKMNYSNNGWYYNSANDKSPSWTGVNFFYQFLVDNRSYGPYGGESNFLKLQEGDFAQLSFDGVKFAHTLVIIKKGSSISDTFVATHTFDSYGRQISSYNYKKIRYIHIDGVRY